MRLVIRNPELRARAIFALRELPLDPPSEVVVKPYKANRSLEQNALFHAICSDVARQKEFAGKRLRPEQWKVLFVSGHATATAQGSEIVPGLEGEFVAIRESTAGMSVARMTSLIEYTLAWCAENDVTLRAPEYHYTEDEENVTTA